jgi:hypothetical protein
MTAGHRVLEACVGTAEVFDFEDLSSGLRRASSSSEAASDTAPEHRPIMLVEGWATP